MNRKEWREPNLLVLGLQDTKSNLKSLTRIIDWTCRTCGDHGSFDPDSGGCFTHICPKKS